MRITELAEGQYCTRNWYNGKKQLVIGRNQLGLFYIERGSVVSRVRDDSTAYGHVDFELCTITGEKMETPNLVPAKAPEKITALYEVFCRYRNFKSTTFDSQEYLFYSAKAHFEGELVVVKDRYGFSLVQVVKCVEVDLIALKNNIAWIVDLEELNNEALKAINKKNIRSKIREALIQDIENSAFERLVATRPDLKDLVDEYRQTGGSYSELLPSIKNLLNLED